MYLTYVGKAAVVHGRIYCVSGRLGILYTISLTDWKIKSICKLDFGTEQDYADVFYDNRNIWCVPKFGTRIAQYNLDTGIVLYYDAANQGENRRNGFNVLIDSTIYMVPYRLTGDLVVFNIRTQKFGIAEEWNEHSVEYRDNIIGTAILAGNSVIMSLCLDIPYYCGQIKKRWTKKVLQFDLLRRELKSFILPENVFCIAQGPGKFYFACTDMKKVLVWDEKTHTLNSCYCLHPRRGFYLRGIPLGNRIMFIDGENIDVLEDGEVTSFSVGDEIKSFNKETPLFSAYTKWKNQVIMLPHSANAILSVTEGSMEVNTYRITLPYVTEVINYLIRRCSNIYENEILLKDYLKAITNGMGGEQSMGDPKQTIGMKIFQTVSEGK